MDEENTHEEDESLEYQVRIMRRLLETKQMERASNFTISASVYDDMLDLREHWVPRNELEELYLERIDIARQLAALGPVTQDIVRILQTLPASMPVWARDYVDAIRGVRSGPPLTHTTEPD